MFGKWLLGGRAVASRIKLPPSCDLVGKCLFINAAGRRLWYLDATALRPPDHLTVAGRFFWLIYKLKLVVSICHSCKFFFHSKKGYKTSTIFYLKLIHQCVILAEKHYSLQPWPHPNRPSSTLLFGMMFFFM